ncbi:hypothetical protein O181_012463 [Austropuccinia psidii MF-1]|uniref:Reverse transcriptase Ty1/copia-type domain-containing protein n=1 Tax=Austropuccinia psidii MF-1 TaxID=1389203 RepID=A0A9Q3GM84_9BASI|nr:hypothetical protein [Austropuccinia psidii MF-1]
MDVKCAFLNGKTNKDLYIKRPNGYDKLKPIKYFKLNQSLYGFKQSPQYWHIELKNALLKIGLCPCQTDSCLFYSPNSNKEMLLYVHVDDLNFGGSWKGGFKMKIKSQFNNHELEFQLINSQHTNCPLLGNIRSFRTIESKEINPPFKYQRAINLLKYLVQCTRPDLAFSTSFLSQYLENAKDLHYNAVKHVLTYLNSTKYYELCLSQNILQQTNNSILAFTNIDWGGSGGYKYFSTLIIYYYVVIGCRTHKQKVVSLSSAEAE